MNTIEIKDLVAIGEQLKEAREAKNLSLEDIAQRTKLRKDQVKAIEEGNFSNLPPMAYVKGFVKLYSKAVGLDINHTAAATVDTITPQTPSRRQPMKRSSVSIDFSKIIFLIVFLSIVALSVYLIVGYFTTPKTTIDLPENSHPPIIGEEDENNQNDQIDEDQEPVVDEPVIDEPEIALIIANNKYTYEVSNQDNLEVLLDVSGQSWLTLTADGKNILSDMLNDELLIEANESITMRIGLAANVNIVINGQLVEFSDQSGAVNVEIYLIQKNGE